MPELPEVETIARRLETRLVGETIAAISVLRHKSFQGDVERLIGQRVTAINRRAKLIYLRLSQDNLLIHLKMTGQLILMEKGMRFGGGHPSPDWVRDLPSTHTRVVIEFESGKTLFFNDQRVFGWIKVVLDNELAQEFMRYGPDVIDQLVTTEWLFSRLQRRAVAIKQAVMDASLVAGVGNIYACDGLFLAGIDPTRASHSLSFVEVGNLLTQLKTVVNRGIELGGATIDTYRNLDGLAGGYQNELQVYGREGESCHSCQSTILRFKQAGRSTFWCENCQN